ncbi:Putative 115 kDa protein in type-1 retrotransposable element R1DM [Eumeta japonica]|uniref:115 kDa protein in type-1 retrotransposable element R1DM n=1 Tax=Eumeta variegata TaxID=151549 RepID=A0A4C1ZTM9_EUMVA|nr:Putative 115 kDa protein in type-1 retrotransposable element R1DM [Eumeta japonica]
MMCGDIMQGYLRDREAFADDVILMIFRQPASSIEEETNRALARVNCWGVRNKLRFAPSKTNSMVLNKNLKYDDPVVQMNSEQISLVGEIRLLGLTIDRKLTFIPHVAKACKKATNIYKGLARAGRVTWSLGLEARPEYFGDLPNSVHVPEIGYESVEDIDSQTMDRFAGVGPQIYTDGTRMEGKVGVTEWRDREETWYSTLRLDPFCTVFQADMGMLQRAIRRAKKGKDGLVNIFSNSRSSLEVLTDPGTYHPLVHKARCDISAIVAKGKAVRLFWVRVHVEIAGNERADELARQAALTKKTATHYDRFPLSHAKKVIRAASLEEWLQQYNEGSTGKITECLFPRVEQAYRILGKI